MRVSTTSFQNAFGKHLKLAIDGEDIIVTKNGKGVAKLIPYQDPMMYVMKEGASDYYIRKRVTYDEFIEITQNSEGRYELIDGELYLLASPKHKHQVAVREIFVQLYNWFQDRPCSPLTAPLDVHLSNGSSKFEDDPNIVQPDILVICDEEMIDDNDHYQGLPSLVVEVLSPSTRSKDMIKKLNLYMCSGIKEYWIVDARDGKVYIYSFLNGDIETLDAYKFGEQADSLVYEGLSVDTTLLKRLLS